VGGGGWGGGYKNQKLKKQQIGFLTCPVSA
jgi:hypothetical protein